MRSTSNFISNPERISRGARVLFRAMRPVHTDILIPETRFTPEDFEYALYCQKGKAFRTVMLLYGMTIEGKDDVRVMNFARSCANAGLRVIVPHLPGLMGFLVEQSDLLRLESILKNAAQESDEKIGLIGFSTGGSYSLLLSANPSLSEMIGPVVLFSPIYDVRVVAERLHAPFNPPPQAEKDWDQYYWAQYVIAMRNRDQLGLTEAVQEALQILLADYDNYEPEVKQAFFDKHIGPLNLIERSDLVFEGVTLDVLSARGHLAAVKSPVFILHDASDQLVPPEQSRRMHSELALRGPGFRQEILVTPWLSHVAMKNSGSPAELFRIVSFISELFRITH